MLAVSGTMIQIHFCDKKVESWTVNTPKTACCCEEGIASVQQSTLKIESQDCCSDRTIIAQTVSDQISNTPVQFQFSDLHAIIPAKIILPEFQLPVSLAANAVFESNAPPGLWQEIPLYKLHQRFTYYG